MVTSSPDGVIVDVRVIPRAARSAIAGTRHDAVLVRLKAPPVDGAANAELIRLLADLLGLPQRNIRIVSGERSRGKRVRISGRTAAEVERILSNPAEAGVHGTVNRRDDPGV
jgi:uncharacterized protein (TIGR00251 family)